MAEARIEHILRSSPSTFWKVFFDADYNRRLFREVLGFPLFEQRAFEEDDRHIRRVLYVSPKVTGVPGPLKPLVGDGLSYTEEGTFDKAAQIFRFRATPSTMPDKVAIRGALSVVALGPDRTARVFEASVKASLFGIGGMLEKQIIADMQHNQALAASFTDRYAEEHALTPRPR